MNSISSYLEYLQAHGRYSFTLEDAVSALKRTKQAVRLALLRQKQKANVAEPRRGLFLIVPPQYRHLRCLPPDQCIRQIMEYLKLPYYVCLLSSAQMYGATHHQPQVFQVMTNKNIRNIHCGKTRIEFIKRKNLVNMPTKEFKTPRGMIVVATPEATALDLVHYHKQAGGMGNVINVLAELVENITPQQLKQVLSKSHSLSDLQRLGYLFDFLGFNTLTHVIEKYLESYRIRPCPLLEQESVIDAELNTKWKILINTELELEL